MHVKKNQTCDTGSEMMFALVCLEAIRVAKGTALSELIRVFASVVIYTPVYQSITSPCFPDTTSDEAKISCSYFKNLSG